MANVSFHRSTTLPETLTPYGIYFIAPPSRPDYIELYVTDALGSSAKRIIQEQDVQALIAASAVAPEIPIVNNIAERDALSPVQNIQAFVLDASADPTVNSGAAYYIYRHSDSSWNKVSEFESLDLSWTVNWGDILGIPASSPTAIDTAVENSHTHSNKQYLNKIGEDPEGNLLYNGEYPAIAWEATDW